jgi:hypothetical protein
MHGGIVIYQKDLGLFGHRGEIRRGIVQEFCGQSMLESHGDHNQMIPRQRPEDSPSSDVGSR